MLNYHYLLWFFKTYMWVMRDYHAAFVIDIDSFVCCQMKVVVMCQYRPTYSVLYTTLIHFFSSYSLPWLSKVNNSLIVFTNIQKDGRYFERNFWVLDEIFRRPDVFLCSFFGIRQFVEWKHWSAKKFQTFWMLAFLRLFRIAVEQCFPVEQHLLLAFVTLINADITLYWTLLSLTFTDQIVL